MTHGTEQPGLFAPTEPLAARMRPRTLDELVGQERVLAPGRLLRRAIETDKLSSLILSGPPGTGKTTLARLIALHTDARFETLNAVLAGVAEIRRQIEEAAQQRDRTGRRTILFVDEVHRWNRSQQDALLPWVESGLIVLVGATTQNPWFEVNGALLSRSTVFRLESLTQNHLATLLERALTDRLRGYGGLDVKLEPDARDHLIRMANGDARRLFNALELAVESSRGIDAHQSIRVTLGVAEESIQMPAIRYDRGSDYHYDTLSAFIKSLRGSDPDAALYWLARMVVAGEDPRSIVRRMLILAAEDVGLADPNALTVVSSAAEAFDRVGMPEGQYLLGEAALYLALAPKSNSVGAYFAARAAVEAGASDAVPLHLRDASRDGEALGHGADYRYPHDAADHWVPQRYLPVDERFDPFYEPGEAGWEATRREELLERREIQRAMAIDAAAEAAVVGASRDELWRARTERSTSAGLSSLQRQLLDSLQLVGEARVLLHGEAIASLAVPVLDAVPGGMLSLWADAATVSTVQNRLRLPLDVSNPEVLACELLRYPTPSQDGRPPFAGPFDRICVRLLTRSPGPAEIRDYLAPLLDAAGRAVVCLLDCIAGTRPSEVLADIFALDAGLCSLSDAAERDVCGGVAAAWRSAAETVSSHTEEFDRTVDGATAQRWYAEGTALGDALRRVAGQESTERFLAQLEGLPPRNARWRRVYLVAMVTGDT